MFGLYPSLSQKDDKNIFIPIKNSYPNLPCCLQIVAHKVDALLVILRLKQAPISDSLSPNLLPVKTYEAPSFTDFYKTHPYLTMLTTTSFIGLVTVGAFFYEELVDTLMPPPPPPSEGSSLLTWVLVGGGALLIASAGTKSCKNKKTKTLDQLSNAYLTIFKDFLNKINNPQIDKNALYALVKDTFKAAIQQDLAKEKPGLDQKEFLLTHLFSAVKRHASIFEKVFTLDELPNPPPNPQSTSYTTEAITNGVINTENAAQVENLSLLFEKRDTYFNEGNIQAALKKNIWKNSDDIYGHKQSEAWSVAKRSILDIFRLQLQKFLVDRPCKKITAEDHTEVTKLDTLFLNTVEAELTKYEKNYQDQNLIYANLSKQEQIETLTTWMQKAVSVAVTKIFEWQDGKYTSFKNYYQVGQDKLHLPKDFKFDKETEAQLAKTSLKLKTTRCLNNSFHRSCTVLQAIKARLYPEQRPPL